MLLRRLCRFSVLRMVWLCCLVCMGGFVHRKLFGRSRKSSPVDPLKFCAAVAGGLMVSGKIVSLAVSVRVPDGETTNVDLT